jgi:vancomycin resistance protein YoaR
LNLQEKKSRRPVGTFLVYNFMRNYFLKIIGVFAFSSVLATLSLVSYDFVKNKELFPRGSYIGKLEVSGLTRDEAAAKLKKSSLSKAFTPSITLEADFVSFSFKPEQLGVYILYNESLKKAFNLAHGENFFADLKQRLLREHFFAPLILGLNEKKARRMLSALANKVRSTPKDATILYYEETGGYNIEREDLGRELNIDQSIAALKAALSQGKNYVHLALNVEYPRIVEKDLRAAPPVYRLSAYTTYYGAHDSPNRIHNIKLIASWIDGTVLMPGDVFSVAEVLGDVTPEKGFKEAFVIIGGELVPSLGGGACQVATTLYNTVALADIKVLQRRNHSFYFNIYPLGRDAGVYPGQLDFRFENDTGYPILIKSIATNRRLSFRIYGTPNGKKVKFSGASVLGKDIESGSFTPMSLKKVIDEDIPFKTYVTRTVYNKKGKLIKQEKIQSYYKLYGDKENVPIKRPEPR